METAGSAAPEAGATGLGGPGATGATGSEKAKKASKDPSKKISSKTGLPSSARAKAKSRPSTLAKVPASIRLSTSDRKAVRAAFNRYVDALLNGDVDYLCNVAYSGAYIKLLAEKGGCQAVTNKQVEGITSYATKVRGIALVPGTEIAAVYADFDFKNATGPHQTYGGIFFVKEAGEWKRAVPPKT